MCLQHLTEPLSSRVNGAQVLAVGMTINNEQLAWASVVLAFAHISPQPKTWNLKPLLSNTAEVKFLRSANNLECIRRGGCKLDCAILFVLGNKGSKAEGESKPPLQGKNKQCTQPWLCQVPSFREIPRMVHTFWQQCHISWIGNFASDPSVRPAFWLKKLTAHFMPSDSAALSPAECIPARLTGSSDFWPLSDRMALRD